MKTLLLFGIALSLTFSGFTQQRIVPPKAMRDHAVRVQHPANVNTEFIKTPGIPGLKDDIVVDEEIIGGTRYDLQSNTSCQNRLHRFDDGTVGATWTMGFDDATSFPDRGTGYNYYDGNNWGPAPTNRIETVRTGWPSYMPFGENGELVVSHNFGPGTLILNSRPEKGTGAWSESEFTGPGVPISWNRTITSGTDNSTIQSLYITWPVANTGTIYEGLDGALLYSRSSDGGVTWDPEHEILDGLTSDEYVGFSADEYEWASQGDNIAFLVGESWIDFILMKSTDNGDTWTKTVIWENPYPFFDPAAPTVTDTFYCVDGDHHLAFDSQGKVHVVFGIDRAYSDGAGTFYFPLVDGVGYWNEDMPTFSNDLNALNPYGEAGTELVEDYNLVGWSPDINNNGTWDILGEPGTYYVGASSMPQIVIDNMDNIYIVYASITESYDNGLQDYRHLWARGSWGEGSWGQFVDLTGSLIHIFDECVFPSIASKTDDNFYLIYESDNEPGLAERGDEDPYGDNNINFMSVPLSDIIAVGIDENQSPVKEGSVSQNMPNPFHGKSWVSIELIKSCQVNLEVTNLTGQVVYKTEPQDFSAGSHRLEIDAQDFTPGVYFYTVNAGDAKITKKMIVK